MNLEQEHINLLSIDNYILMSDITNEIYIDRNNEYEETIRYADYLAYINRRLTELSEKAYEVVCGIPIELKKKEEI